MYLWIFLPCSPLVALLLLPLVVEHYTFVSQLFEQEQQQPTGIRRPHCENFSISCTESSGFIPTRQHDDEEICKIIHGSVIRGIIKWFSSSERISSRRPTFFRPSFSDDDKCTFDDESSPGGLLLYHQQNV